MKFLLILVYFFFITSRAETLKFIDSLNADEDCQTIKAKHPEMKIVCQDSTIISEDDNNINPLTNKAEPTNLKKKQDALPTPLKSDKKVAEYNIQDLFEENNSASPNNEVAPNNFSSWSSNIKPVNLSEIHDSFKGLEVENAQTMDIDAVLNKIEQSNKIISDTKYNNFLKKPEKEAPITTTKLNNLPSSSNLPKTDKAELTEKFLKDERNESNEGNDKIEKNKKNENLDKIDMQHDKKQGKNLNKPDLSFEKIEDPHKPNIIQPRFLELPSSNHMSGGSVSEESDRKLKRIEEGQKELKKEIENLKNFLLSLNRNYENFSSGSKKSEEELENKLNQNQNKLDLISETLKSINDKVDQSIFVGKEHEKNKEDEEKKEEPKKNIFNKEAAEEKKEDYRTKLLKLFESIKKELN